MTTLKRKIESENQKKIIIYAIDAGSGDCILIHLIDTDIKILIDSGPSKGKGRLNVQKTLSSILSEGNKIDLAIVTHNDDDHIGGFSNLIERNIINIDTMVFNDSTYIKKLFLKHDGKYSLRQDMELHGAAITGKIELKTFHNDLTTDKAQEFHYRGVKLSFFSPDKETLKKYNNFLQKEESSDNTIGKYSGNKKSIIDNVSEFNRIIDELRENDNFCEDRSPSNGTSLAFSLQAGSANFLFLGDALPSVVIEKLKHFNNVDFNICKISHHGSENNTSIDLLRHFKCRNYLICTDGSSHDHPSVKTLARILINNRNSEFYFSSNTDYILKLASCIPVKSHTAQNGYVRFDCDY
jgi:beta-lactamase superfamily II metal-dependent hydrolase